MTRVLMVAAYDDALNAHSAQRERALERHGQTVTRFDLTARPGLLTRLRGGDLVSRLDRELERVLLKLRRVREVHEHHAEAVADLGDRADALGVPKDDDLEDALGRDLEELPVRGVAALEADEVVCELVEEELLRAGAPCTSDGLRAPPPAPALDRRPGALEPPQARSFSQMRCGVLPLPDRASPGASQTMLDGGGGGAPQRLSLLHIPEPTRPH